MATDEGRVKRRPRRRIVDRILFLPDWLAQAERTPEDIDLFVQITDALLRGHKIPEAERRRYMEAQLVHGTAYAHKRRRPDLAHRCLHHMAALSG